MVIEPSVDVKDVLQVVVLGRACRNQANIKNRQPVGLVYVKSDFTLPQFCCEIIEDELNVKRVLFTDDVRDFTTYTFKPQLRTVGPKYGKFLGFIKNSLATLDGNAAMDELEAKGAITLNSDGNEIVPELSPYEDDISPLSKVHVLDLCRKDTPPWEEPFILLRDDDWRRFCQLPTMVSFLEAVNNIP